MSESLTLPCPRCGASLPADPTRAAATCSYCHAQVPIPAEVRQRALDHAARVEAARRKADTAQQAASQLRAFSGGQQVGMIITVVIIVVMVGVGLVANVLGPYLPKGALSILMPLTIYGTIGGAYYVYYRRRKQTASAPLAVATSVCARCGGPLTFVAGGASAVCHACNATAIAGRTLVRDLSAAAERRADDLELDRVRAERQMYRSVAATQRFGHYYLLVAMGWPVAAIGVVGFGAGVSELISGLASGKSRAIAHGLEAFGIGCALAIGALAVGALVYAVVLRPALASGAVLRAITARLGGATTQGGAVAAIDWLDAFWHGQTRYEVMVNHGELVRHTMTTVIDRLPVLVVVLSGGSNVSCPRLHVLVASPRPRDEAAVRATPAARDLLRLGFDVKADSAGVTFTREVADAEVVNEAMLGWVLGVSVAVAQTR